MSYLVVLLRFAELFLVVAEVLLVAAEILRAAGFLVAEILRAAGFLVAEVLRAAGFRSPSPRRLFFHFGVVSSSTGACLQRLVAST